MLLKQKVEWIYDRRKIVVKFRLLTWTSFIGQRVYPVEVERRWGKGGGWGIVILASYKFHFIRMPDNLV